MAASPSELTLCPGFGEQKAHRLHEAFRMPFIPAKAQAESTEKSKSKGKEIDANVSIA
jgi:hypothetical protein